MEVVELMRNVFYFLIVSGTIAWLIRSIIKLYLDKDIEKFRNKLIKENIRFSKLQEERALIIRDLYYKLYQFEKDMKSFTAPFQWAGEKLPKEKHKIASKSGNDFSNYYRKHRIYFSEEICKILDEIDKLFTTSWVEFTTFPLYDPEVKEIKPTERMEKWVKVWDRICTDIPILRKKLEREFREILGVEHNFQKLYKLQPLYYSIFPNGTRKIINKLIPLNIPFGRLARRGRSMS